MTSHSLTSRHTNTAHFQPDNEAEAETGAQSEKQDQLTAKDQELDEQAGEEGKEGTKSREVLPRKVRKVPSQGRYRQGK